jgi:hypothetical protein
MITFSLARTKQVLWIEFGLSISQQAYLRLDEERAAILQREGPMDLIMDFTGAVPAHFPSELAVSRAYVPSPVPGRRRLYVAPGDLIFGMFRMWAIHHDDPKVDIVRSLDEAFAALAVEAGDFVRLPAGAPIARGDAVTAAAIHLGSVEAPSKRRRGPK